MASKVFHVKVNLGNAAFSGDGVYQELPRILNELAKEISEMPLMPIILRDINGNKAGEAYISKES